MNLKLWIILGTATLGYHRTVQVGRDLIKSSGMTFCGEENIDEVI